MAEIPNRDVTERQLELAIARSMRKHRAEYIRLAGDPPDPARVPVDFWLRVREDMERDLAAAYVVIFTDNAVAHGLTPSLAALVAPSIARIRARDVANRYALNSHKTLQRVLFSGGTNPPSADTVISKVFNRGRAAGVATTETTAVASFAAELAVGVSSTRGRGEGDTWFTVGPSACDVCRPLHGQPRSVWSRIFPMGPPAHPSCRCWIQYASERV